MGLLIQGGRVITATDDHPVDVYAEGQEITRIEANIDPSSLPADTEIVDASGKYVFPGFIDPHVHVHLPFMGTNAIDDHDSATRAALAGGTTTIIEMICPGPDEEPLQAFQTWKDLADKSACCDFSFHQSVVRFDELAMKQLRTLVAEHGVQSFKVFLAYKGALDIGDPELFQLLTLAQELGVVVTAHCENAEAIDQMQKRLIATGKTGPEFHHASRPRAVEADGVNHICMFAQLTGTRVYIVHTSCGAALERALASKGRGVDVTVEAVIPHLVLDKTYAERPDFEGAKYVMSPPLRDRLEHNALWGAIRDREIATIGTDHAPFNFADQKQMGRDAFTKIPNGIPSIQERVDLVHTYGVCEDRIDLNTMVDACSTQAAKLFNLYPKKGEIAVGSDADLVVYDPDFRGTFSSTDSLTKIDYCGYEGMERKGRSHVVTLRGQVVARDGAFVGEPANGEYLPQSTGV